MSLPPGPLSPTLLARLDDPAAAPPPGISANIIDPPHSSIGRVNYIACIIIMSIAVFIRMHTKLFIIKRIIIEDRLLFLGYIFAVASCGCCLVQDKFAKGTHLWNLHVRDFINVIFWAHVSGIVYVPAMLFVKLTILCQLRRIFVINRQQSRLLWLAIWLNICGLTAYYLFLFTFSFVMCRPMRKLWDFPLQEGSCFNRWANCLASGAINLVSDFIILVLPIWSTLRLNMRWRQKAGYVAVFGIGIIACILSAMRVGMSPLLREVDSTWNMMRFGVLTAWELTIGIIIASTPGLPTFFRTYGSKLSEAFSKLIGWPRSNSPDMKPGEIKKFIDIENKLHDRERGPQATKHALEGTAILNASSESLLSLEGHLVTMEVIKKPEVVHIV